MGEGWTYLHESLGTGKADFRPVPSEVGLQDTPSPDGDMLISANPTRLVKQLHVGEGFTNQRSAWH